MSIERLTTNPAFGFSDAVTTSGAGPHDPRLRQRRLRRGRQTVVSGGMEAEARATFANIERTLQHARRRPVQRRQDQRLHHRPRRSTAEYAKVRAELFGDRLAGESATVQVAGLLVGAQIEIDAVAFVPEG